MNKMVFGLAAVIIAAVVILLVFMGKGVKTPTPLSNSPSPTVAASPTSSIYSDWTYFRNGYGIKIPPDWKNTSDLNGTAVLEPGSKLAHIIKISITILSDKKATGQRFTTQTEFDQWYGVSGQVQGNIQKLDNILVDGEKAVMLLDTTNGENDWTAIVWTRKDNINLYITVKGNEKYTEEDATAINYIVSSFRFVAPPSTGKEEK